ncbi:hypothetical protein Sru01_21400 [Sphaerisporangium rufum]|uniref:Polymerase nucleotidyl transferase domain-containing protein n=1 Tax=Sphaerisporangium rufum TaxID=1381558 RepID=A0A919V0V5_9ACTN|nr:nucleotidyltransferase domain-containing protein [Sphaerisporangium rufum]GII77158.1 hypothetical protein Sru01_21400 [Sphaerisporangium rufum]
MTGVPAGCQEARTVLGEHRLLPGDALAAFVVGSTARGWANPGSDIDVVVVSAAPFADDRAVTTRVALVPDTLPVVTFRRGERRWELKYWTAAQVDQVMNKITWSAFEADRRVGDRLTLTENLFLARLRSCVPVFGAGWVEQARRRLDGTAYRSFMVIEALAEADDAVEDALGQLAAGDVESAVLSAQAAFGFAVEAVLAGHGEFGPQPKWRARRLRAAAPEILPFAEYWSIQTMRDFDPERPQEWVRRVAETCRRVAMEVEV